MTSSAAAPISPLSSLGLLTFVGGVVGLTFAAPWWLGSPRAMGWALAGGAVGIALAWLLGRALAPRAPLGLFLGVLLIHLAAGVAGVLGGLPWIELLKFLLQGTLLGAVAGSRAARGGVPVALAIAAAALPLILTALAREQTAIEIAEGVRLQGVLAATIERGSAFPDSGTVGRHARVWVVDRGTARLVAARGAGGGDLGELGLEHPGRMLTESGGSYSTRLTRHAVVAWRAVPGNNDVGVVVVIYEPTKDFDEGLGWELLLLVVVVGMGVVVAGKGVKG